MERIYNFSSGPAVLPLPVLEKARDEMLSINGSGMSVMEISHRSSLFGEILASAELGIRSLLQVPNNYRILFLQGGASLQFSMVPMNFLSDNVSADYIVTGVWSKKAANAAKHCGKVNEIFSSNEGGFRSLPKQEELRFTPGSRYIHYVSNETIHGVEFNYDLDGYGAPVFCDASSNILSKPIDIEKYALIYAGAQKNIGPSGVTLVVIRDDLVAAASEKHPILNYSNFAEHDSMPNTPNTWGIYIISLVCDWLNDQGGLTSMKQKNEAKAANLYAAIDSSDGFYRGHADRDARSAMNVTFRLPSEKLEDQFCDEALANGLSGLKGHRSVGGIRASIYNAFPEAGVKALVEFMNDFSGRKG
jgi:phosphoserine aminotransferase